MQLSIVVPVLNEAAGVADALGRLAPLRTRGVEVVVVDGGSDDASAALATPLADRVVAAPRGRARQLNAGVRAARGEALLLLHADTTLPADADALVLEALRTHAWGRFDVAIAGAHRMLPLVATSMNSRSRMTGIATGDQAMFLTRAAYDAVGGVPDLALMEDVSLSAALKRLGPPACLRARVLTSGRRWERDGVLRTILLMWRLRLAFFFGADPARLARAYGYRPADG